MLFGRPESRITDRTLFISRGRVPSDVLFQLRYPKRRGHRVLRKLRRRTAEDTDPNRRGAAPRHRRTGSWRGRFRTQHAQLPRAGRSVNHNLIRPLPVHAVFPVPGRHHGHRRHRLRGAGQRQSRGEQLRRGEGVVAHGQGVDLDHVRLRGLGVAHAGRFPAHIHPRVGRGERLRLAATRSESPEVPERGPGVTLAVSPQSQGVYSGASRTGRRTEGRQR